MAKLNNRTTYECAKALIALKTRLGKRVPAYAKSIVDGKQSESLDKRVRSELKSFMETQKIKSLDGVFNDSTC